MNSTTVPSAETAKVTPEECSRSFAAYARWQAARRRPDGGDLQLCALGLGGESGEIARLLTGAHHGRRGIDRGELINEAGDLLFYLFWSADLWGYSTWDLFAYDLPGKPFYGSREGMIQPLVEFAELAWYIGAIVDATKKQAYHAVPADPHAVTLNIQPAVDCLAAILRAHGCNLMEALAANVRKLEARYPNGFVKGGGIR